MFSELHAKRLLVGLVLLSVLLVAVLARPFWVELTLAAVVAAALETWMNGLTRLLGGRRRLAAASLTLAVLLSVLLPLGGVGLALRKQVLQGIQWVRGALESEGIWGLMHRLPRSIEDAVHRLVTAIPESPQAIQEFVGARSGDAAQAVGGLLMGTGLAVFHAVLFLIALFFLLSDGARLVTFADAHVPLRPGQLRTLLSEFRRTSVSVLVSSLGTALIQAATALVGYVIVRAPTPIFFALVTFIVALIPAAGATVVVVGVAVLLFATGRVLAGVFLALWGVLVVSIVDNVARPYLLKGGMAIHGGLVFFALLGGLSVFGGIGLVVGPLSLTFLITVLKMYQGEFGPHPEQLPRAPVSRDATPNGEAPDSEPKSLSQKTR